MEINYLIQNLESLLIKYTNNKSQVEENLHELITGLRQEGIFFSSVSFSNKMTSGIGTVAAGFALALIDWPTGAAVQTAADIAPETIVWLGLIYGPIVSGFALVSAYCYSKYGLNRRRHAEIVEELAVLRERRAAAAD